MKPLPLLLLALLSSCGKERPYPPNQRGKEILAPEPAAAPPPEPAPPAEEEQPLPPEVPETSSFDQTREVHRQLVATDDSPPDAISMMIYSEDLDDTKIDLLPIPGGTFKTGPADGGSADLAVETEVSPFWIAKLETTWRAYRNFLEDEADRDPPLDHTGSAAGEGSRFPVGSVTHRDASLFCEWLTLQSGHFYRLPTEAEWEFACRAGSTAAWSFGPDAAELDDFAWSAENSSGSVRRTGRKKPNLWGVHDLHGNLAEWCLDRFDPAAWPPGGKDPWQPGDPDGPHVIRGGSIQDSDPQALGSGARASSAGAAPWIGFRVVRPLAIPDATEMHRAWHGETAE